VELRLGGLLTPTPSTITSSLNCGPEYRGTTVTRDAMAQAVVIIDEG